MVLQSREPDAVHKQHMNQRHFCTENRVLYTNNTGIIDTSVQRTGCCTHATQESKTLLHRKLDAAHKQHRNHRHFCTENRVLYTNNTGIIDTSVQRTGCCTHATQESKTLLHRKLDAAHKQHRNQRHFCKEKRKLHTQHRN